MRALPLMLRPSLPIVARPALPLSAQDEQRVQIECERLRRDTRDFELWRGLGGDVECGIGDGPAVLFEDYSPLSLYEGFGQEYRSLVLAGNGDTVLVSEARQTAFEAYCRDRLCLGNARVARVTAQRRTRRQSLAIQACDDETIFGELCNGARDAGSMTVMPHMGTGGSWVLASRIACCAKVPVRVAAPPPKLARRVNDKLWVAEQIRHLLGSDLVPPTFAVYGTSALTARLRRLARFSERVVIKVPQSAGGMGNFALMSEDVLRESPTVLRRRLEYLLLGRGWQRTYPLAVGVWETPVLDNLSVQLWIPRDGDGRPILEGLCSQVVSSDIGAFLGGGPADLPPAFEQQLVHEALMMARLWQTLGYYGRCSFDAILVGKSLGEAQIHWIECNGRWGGASVPMTLANRLVGDWMQRAFVTFQVRGAANSPIADVAAVLRRLETSLFQPARRATGLVLVVSTHSRRGSAMSFIALADSPAELAGLTAQARALADESVTVADDATD